MKVEYHLPALPLLNIASFFCRIRTGAWFTDISPINDLDKIDVPVFFIHGQDDKYIPKDMSIDMYNIKKGPKKLYLAPKFGHAEAFRNNREEYERLVGEFLDEATSMPLK